MIRLKRGVRYISYAAMIVAVILTTAVPVFPNQGISGLSEDFSAAAGVRSDFAGADPYERATHFALKEYSPPILLIQEEIRQEERKPAKNIYDPAVVRVLKRMGLSTDKLDEWAARRDRTTLKALPELSPDDQKMVAAIASYIRKFNGKISAETVWREACAFVVFSRDYGVTPELAAALGKVESTFDPNCKSRRGATGVMQVVYNIHYAALIKNGIVNNKGEMFDPERGIEAGLFVLAGYIRATGSKDKGLRRYYGGGSSAYFKRIENSIDKLKAHM